VRKRGEVSGVLKPKPVIKPSPARVISTPTIPSVTPRAPPAIQPLRRPAIEVKEAVTVGTILNKLQRLEAQLGYIDNIRKGIERTLRGSRRIRPSFSASWVIPNPPYDARKIKEYRVMDSTITLYQLRNETECLYHLTPAEYNLSENEMRLLDLVREELIEYFPPTLRLSRPDHARDYVYKRAMRSLYKLAKKHDISLGSSRPEEVRNVKRLSEIIARYTAGMGIAEILLKDPYIQDIYIDAPADEKNVYVILGDVGDDRVQGKCITNIILTSSDAESLLSRLRYESGRPFSEAMPVLECDLDMYNTRATVIGSPLSPAGTAFALRRHSTEPWTLLKLINAGSITPLAAGLISFLVDGRSTILVAGSRGAGKTSLLGAIMLELPKSQRVLTIEDTLELPGPEMCKLGYKVQSIHVRSSVGGMSEMTADDALRVALRLGESAIVLGEVRGEETKTLYEAMRAGTAGSTVLGTFHANSARAVYERVVHDMGIPSKSFKATDIIIISGLTRPSGVQREIRRVTQITEVVKETEEEGVFNDLMVYNSDADALVETDVFRYSSERIGAIARSWGISLEEALQNIETRGKMRSIMVEHARRYNKPSILSAKWVRDSNNVFWDILDRQQRGGKIDYNALFNSWLSWFRRNVAYE
jgi:type IV secretory pathway ATPase VirB11/archaellum biosynthesis ATPase